MIDLEYIRSFFPPVIAGDSRFNRYMLKEYLQLLILNHLSATPYIHKLSFIGGTNLRLVQGIDRFSEDLDFDCKNLSREGISSVDELRAAVAVKLQSVDLDHKKRDFAHLLFNEANSERILQFPAVFEEYLTKNLS